jgi:general stress protein CsbA
MLMPVATYAQLAVGCLMLPFAIIVLITVVTGSRSTFALLMVVLSIALELQNIISFFSNYYTMTIIVNGEEHQYQEFYIWQTSNYWYYLANIQSWIFAMRYLESAITCSNAPKITLA